MAKGVLTFDDPALEDSVKVLVKITSGETIEVAKKLNAVIQADPANENIQKVLENAKNWQATYNAFVESATKLKASVIEHTNLGERMKQLAAKQTEASKKDASFESKKVDSSNVDLY